MNQAITTFLTGVSGVFSGMAMLYLAILIVPLITDRLEASRRKNLEIERDDP